MGIRGELFSTKVILQNRTYFFNVKENRLGDLYLNIVESKNRDEGGFERQSVILFADDLQDFLRGFDDALHVMEKAVREKRRGTPGREQRIREPRNDEQRDREPRSREQTYREPRYREQRNKEPGFSERNFDRRPDRGFKEPRGNGFSKPEYGRKPAYRQSSGRKPWENANPGKPRRSEASNRDHSDHPRKRVVVKKKPNRD